MSRRAGASASRRTWLRAFAPGAALGAALLLSLAPSLGDEAPPRDSPAGTWEGVLVTPQRPVVLTLRLGPEGSGWTGALIVSGRQTIPLAVELGGDGRLRLSAAEAELGIDARVEGTTILGTLRQGEEAYAFSLEREPALPRPASRAEAWRQDLDVAERKLPRYDRSLSVEEARRFRAAIARLRQGLDRSSDADVVVGLARAVALAGNAHTRLYLLRNRTELRRLPIRLWWFEDSLRVVRATAPYRELVGCEVRRIGGRSPEAARRAVAPMFAGNPSWRSYMSVYSLTSPEALAGSGLAREIEEIPWQLRCGGRQVRVTLAPLPLVRRETPTEAWWDLSPAHAPADGEPWIGVPLPEPLPLYLRRPEQNYWHEYSPSEQALYFGYRRAQPLPSGPPPAEYVESLARELGAAKVRRVVVDLRFNTGGDQGVGRQAMERLRAWAREKGAPVVVVSGRATFSAGLFHLAEWKLWGARVVGEPAGDALDFWSEGGNIRLPNSGLLVHYANAFHSLSSREHPEAKPYFSDLDVASVAPDEPVAMTWEAYRRGEDPAWTAALR